MKYQEAVDLVLQFTGETPVNSPNEHPNQGVITRFIDSSVAREQLMNWWFNQEYGVTLQPDSNGKVPISSSLKKVIFESHDLVARGKYVYDQENQTYLIRTNVSILKATRELQWDNLPELMQQWCMFQGAKYYILGTIGDSGLTKELKEEANRTYVLLKTEDIEAKNVNVFNTPRIASNRSGRRPYGGR